MCCAFINQKKNRLNIQTAFTFTNSQSYLLPPLIHAQCQHRTYAHHYRSCHKNIMPTKGDTTAPKKNGAKPSRADADPAFCLSLFIASADMADNTSPIKNSGPTANPSMAVVSVNCVMDVDVAKKSASCGRLGKYKSTKKNQRRIKHQVITVKTTLNFWAMT